MKKFIAILLTLTISIVACFSLVACSNSNDKASVDIPEVNSSDSINYISLYSSPVIYSDNYVAKTITATVYPESALDKSLNWEVVWIENNEGSSAVVTDYVKVEPTSDGALTAEVRCYKAFENSVIGVKVTTRVGSCSAICNVKYVGTPSSLEIVQNGGTLVHNEDWDVDVINLPVGQNYVFDLQLNNIFNKVTDKFERNFVIETSILGSAIVTPIIDGKLWNLYANDLFSDCYNSIFSFSTGCGGITFQVYFVDGSLRDNSLFLEVKSSVEDLIDDDNFFVELSDNKIPLFQIKITELNSNISDSIYIRPITIPLDVSLNENLDF